MFYSRAFLEMRVFFVSGSHFGWDTYDHLSRGKTWSSLGVVAQVNIETIYDNKASVSHVQQEIWKIDIYP